MQGVAAVRPHWRARSPKSLLPCACSRPVPCLGDDSLVDRRTTARQQFANSIHRLALRTEPLRQFDCWEVGDGWAIAATIWTDSEALTEEQRSLLDGSLAEAIASTRL